MASIANSEKQFLEIIDNELKRNEAGLGMGHHIDDVRILKSNKALNVLKARGLRYVKEHANEDSGIQGEGIATVTYAEAVKMYLHIELNTFQLGGKRRNRKRTQKNRRNRSRKNNM